MSENIKQVIVIRKDLNMRKGKYISQACHSCLKIFLDSCEKTMISSSETKLEFIYNKENVWGLWLDGLYTKIIVGCDSEEELIDIYQQAKYKGLPCVLITDVGLTEFNGVPTKTCVAIGPAKPEDINPITKHLKLL
jgi:PTH2 family peptidyl-tRNA hydrolase